MFRAAAWQPESCFETGSPAVGRSDTNLNFGFNIMNRKTVKKTICCLLSAAMLFLSGCTLPGSYWVQGEIPESTEGKDLTMGDAVDNVFSLNCNTKYSFNPLIATNHSNQLIDSLVYENIVEVDNNFEVLPGIVSEWECNDSGTSWVLTLDSGHTFSDGTPVTSKDLRYSLDRAVSSDRFSGRFTTYQGSAQDGDDKLKITISIGDTQFIKLLNIPVIKYGEYDEKFPTGSGPYMFTVTDREDKRINTSYRPGEDEDYDVSKLEETTTTSDGSDPYKYPSRVLMSTTNEGPYTYYTYKILKYLDKNPYYDAVDSLPLERIYITCYTDAGDIIDNFESSKIDAVLNDPSSYTNLGYASTNESHTYATTNMHFVAFNQDTTVGAISGFRYAMQYAFNRAALVELLGNNAVASAVPMYPTCSAYPSDLNSALAYDIDKCAIILENNGIRDYDEDGYREWINGGSTVSLNFILCSDSSVKAGIANRFASDMESIGIKVTVQALTWTDYYNAITNYENFTKEQLEDEDFRPIEYDMYYAEVKLRNDFNITELLQQRTDNNHATNINFTNSTGNGYETYLYNYLASGDSTRKTNYRAFAEYVLTNLAQFVVIGFEKQQLITHRQAIRGVDPNMGNPFYNFKNWTIMFEEDKIND